METLHIAVISAGSTETVSSNVMNIYMVCFHLQAGDGEAASVIRQSGNGNDERRVWDVFIVELNGNLIVTWREDITAKCHLILLCHIHTSPL